MDKQEVAVGWDSSNKSRQAYRVVRGMARAISRIVSRHHGVDSFWLRTDSENWSISKFVKNAANQIPSESLVFDAGAGTSPYSTYFQRHRYQTCDIKGGKNVTFLADLHQLPVPDSSYDAIICTQVLEHVPYPQKVVDELFRSLRPGGTLFLTVPQGQGLHFEPNHYFNFTRYGLDLLFRNSGFANIDIQERGGIFWFIGKRARALVPYIYAQYHGPARGLLFLLNLLTIVPLQYVIPLAMFYADRIDKKKGWTNGYACTCQKTAEIG